MMRRNDEDQLNQILMETFANSQYIDEEIGYLLKDGDDGVIRSAGRVSQSEQSEQPFSRRISQSSKKSQSSLQRKVQDILHSNDNEDDALDVEIQIEEEQEKQQQYPQQQYHEQSPYTPIYNHINKCLQPIPIETIRHSFPLYQLSQPTYTLSNNIKEMSLPYSSTLLRKEIKAMTSGWCKNSKSWKIAIGTADGCVYFMHSEPSIRNVVLSAFHTNHCITALAFSQNLQYFAVSSRLKSIKVYSLKHAVQIQNNVSYRLLPEPSELWEAGEKLVKGVVRQMAFVKQNPFKLVIVDEDGEIYVIQMKKHIINLRPVASLLPIKFPFSCHLNLVSLSNKMDNASLLIVPTGHHITFIVLQPAFEILMVYDKERHGSGVDKSGWPVIATYNPSKVMIMWGKWVEIMHIQAIQLEPFKHSVRIQGSYELPDSTLVGGFISQTLIYQISLSGLKLYSITNHKNQNNVSSPPMILHLSLDFSSLPMEIAFQEPLSLVGSLQLHSTFSASHGMLMWTDSEELRGVAIQTWHEYVGQTIQSKGDWKGGLQILCDAFKGNLYQFDNINAASLKSKIMQYSVRYVNFLQSVIKIDEEHPNSMMLWQQQTLFLMNLLIQCSLQDFMLSALLPLLNTISSQLLRSLTPFILARRLNIINLDALKLIEGIIDREVVGRWILNMGVVEQSSSSQEQNQESRLKLSQNVHLLNGELVRQGYFLEMIEINIRCNDFYTPFAILISKYTAAERRQGQEAVKSLEQVAQLLSYLTYDTLDILNTSRSQTLTQKIQIISSLLPLFKYPLFTILLHHHLHAFYHYIILQLFSGTCLQVLNTISLKKKTDIMEDLITSIQYEGEVKKQGMQRTHWCKIMNLMRKGFIKCGKKTSSRLGSYIQQVNPYNGTFIPEGLMVMANGKGTPEQKNMLQGLIQERWITIFDEVSQLSRQQLENLFSLSIESQHILLAKLVGGILKKPLQVLQAMIKCEQYHDIRIFQYIDEIIAHLSGKEVQTLIKILKKSLSLLASINPSLLSSLLSKYFPSQLLSFLPSLEAYPEQQLELLKHLLELHQYREEMKPMKVQYLDLLGKLGRHRQVVQQLQRQQYPLDQSFEVCQRWNILQGMAYLLIKSGGQGDISKAIHFYFEIMNRDLSQLLVNLAMSDWTTLQVELSKQFAPSLSSCLELTLFHHSPTEQQLHTFIHQLQHLKLSLSQSHPYNYDIVREVINKQGYQRVAQVVSGMHNGVSSISQEMNFMDVAGVQVVVSELNKRFAWERSMLKLIHQDYISSELIYRKDILSTQLMGFITKNTCDICGQVSFPPSVLIHYSSCQHQIHPSCSHDLKECMICSERQDKMIERRIDVAGRVKVEMLAAGKTEQNTKQVNKKEKWEKMWEHDQEICKRNEEMMENSWYF